MKRTMIAMTALALVLSVAGPAVAGNDQGGGKTTTMEGWITCECCTAHNANAEGKACTLACNKTGKPLVLVSGGKAYKLSDQKAALAQVGHEVVVTGTMAKDGTVTVVSIEPKKS